VVVVDTSRREEDLVVFLQRFGLEHVAQRWCLRMRGSELDLRRPVGGGLMRRPLELELGALGMMVVWMASVGAVLSWERHVQVWTGWPPKPWTRTMLVGG
jgi:hypothetical protein